MQRHTIDFPLWDSSQRHKIKQIHNQEIQDHQQITELVVINTSTQMVGCLTLIFPSKSVYGS
jgi:hypothetical protein